MHNGTLGRYRYSPPLGGEDEHSLTDRKEGVGPRALAYISLPPPAHLPTLAAAKWPLKVLQTTH